VLIEEVHRGPDEGAQLRLEPVGRGNDLRPDGAVDARGLASIEATRRSCLFAKCLYTSARVTPARSATTPIVMPPGPTSFTRVLATSSSASRRSSAESRSGIGTGVVFGGGAGIWE